jgi:RNA polymerase sigma-70 factor (ECF subfamily)
MDISRAELKDSPKADWLASAQRGDEAAFQTLYETHKRRAFSLCLRMTGNPAEAEELTQDAFLLVFRKVHTFRGESEFSTWLHRLVVNVALAHLRKKRIQQVPLDAMDPSQEEPVRREFGEDDRRLSGTADRISLARAIRGLARGYRTVFVLHDVEGYDHAEIARMMNWTVGNSKSQLHKARLRLRQRLRLEWDKTLSPGPRRAGPGRPRAPRLAPLSAIPAKAFAGL